jgi:hypothetical protein
MLTSIFTPECENEELPSLTDNYPSMPEITVTANGTEKLLSKLDPSKATGPDCYVDQGVLTCY